ncbi:MAG: CBS domain-containing protein [Chloroflexota bacterium]
MMRMNVLDMMTKDPITVQADFSLRKALSIMDQNSIKHVPVMSKQGHLIGVLSDRDCRHALNSPFVMRERWQDEELAIRVQVRSVMTPAPIVVEPNTPADKAVGLMLEHRIGCLPVMRAETLVGIITRSDILVAFMNMHRHYERIAQDIPGIARLPRTNAE